MKHYPKLLCGHVAKWHSNPLTCLRYSAEAVIYILSGAANICKETFVKKLDIISHVKTANYTHFFVFCNTIGTRCFSLYHALVKWCIFIRLLIFTEIIILIYESALFSQNRMVSLAENLVLATVRVLSATRNQRKKLDLILPVNQYTVRPTHNSHFIFILREHRPFLLGVKS